MAKKIKTVKPKYPKVFEGFNGRGIDFNPQEPTAVNIISIIRYRTTVEVIEEPKEVYQERIQHLWDYCNSYQRVYLLRELADKYSYELKRGAGNKLNP